MQFMRTEELKPGLRLAKPIYNKNGVLLYERNSRLTIPAINSIRNFDLIGVYILEPAEPVPPFTREDVEFEQAQTVYLFKLRDIYEKLYKRESLDKLPALIEDIVKRYGNLQHRVNFNQNIRSPYDFMYKHAISTSVLSAIIGQHIDMSELDFQSLLAASLLIPFGYRFIPKNLLRSNGSEGDYNREEMQTSLEKGLAYLNVNMDRFDFMPQAMELAQYFILSNRPNYQPEEPSDKVLLLYEILKVAQEFDLMTGAIMGHEPQSEIIAMNYLQENYTEYNDTIVSILARSIHIIPAGASVDLSTGDKAVVLVENPKNFMQPVILRLRDNQIYDLSDSATSQNIQILDLMKTMDNRIEIDANTVKLFSSDERIKAITERYKQKKQK